ncbi:cytochrome P450 [Xylaria arbuscula]|nr:cytochrome P450 [Xylaria arbuscula]
MALLRPRVGIRPSFLSFSALLTIGLYLYSRLYYKRFIHNAHVPQLPVSLFWGHLFAFYVFRRRGLQDRHPDMIIADMHKRLGAAPLLLFDSWPVLNPIVIVASHDVAEQISRASNLFPYSIPRSPSLERVMQLIGPDSMILKNVSIFDIHVFSPGFSPKHIISLLPIILGKAVTYIDILNTYSQTGRVFSLDQYTTNLTFDIIGVVTMNEDMGCRHLDPASEGEPIRLFKEMIKSHADDKLYMPWWVNPWTHLKRRWFAARISRRLKCIVQRNFSHMNILGKSARSIISLGLRETCDQLKSFLFAGHDTTSTTIIWAIYELARTPCALKAIKVELDELFGAGSSSSDVAAKLLSPGGDKIIHRMTYIRAVIKEVLRLYPPGSSVRMVRGNSGFTVSTTRGEYNLRDNWIYLNHHLIHRDKSVYGDNTECFVPDRWLDLENSIPARAWQPFERGPRNCIGQELATLEARVIIILVIRQYDFVKIGLGELELDRRGRPVLDEETRQFRVRSELHSVIQITRKPAHRMMMKVKLEKGGKPTQKDILSKIIRRYVLPIRNRLRRLGTNFAIMFQGV